MRTTVWAGWILLSLAVLRSPLISQDTSDTKQSVRIAGRPEDLPVGVTICDLARTPERYRGRMVKVRGRVEVAFEKFEITAEECEGRNIDAIWLEYGHGPKRQPTTWCCGDLTPRDSLALVQDGEFRRFDRLLRATKPMNRITTTLTGRFEAVDTEPCPGDANARCCGFGNFGHFGASCARLVIQRVAEVEARRK